MSSNSHESGFMATDIIRLVAYERRVSGEAESDRCGDKEILRDIMSVPFGDGRLVRTRNMPTGIRQSAKTTSSAM